MSARILLIEDNAQNRYLLTFLLVSQGHSVVSAEDGPAGLRCAAQQPFDLVLLDIQLPGMDGYAVGRWVGELPGAARGALVAVTSYAMSGDRERVLAAGCSGYLEKPIDPDGFTGLISTYLPPAAPEQIT